MILLCTERLKMKIDKHEFLEEVIKQNSLDFEFRGKAADELLDALYLDVLNNNDYIAFDFEGNYYVPISFAFVGKDVRKFFRVVDYKNEHEFLSSVDNFIRENNHYLYIATNLEYDISLLVLNRKEDFYIKYNSGKILYVFDKQNSVFFTDTLNFIPASVKVLGENFVSPPITKLNKPRFIEVFIDFEKNTMSALKNVSLNDRAEYYKPFKDKVYALSEQEWKDIEEYNTTDAQISYLAMENYRKFFKEEIGVRLSFTTPSVAFRIMKSKKLTPVSTSQAELGSQAYRGGRVEAFVYGHVDLVRVYDVNSLYPYAMTKTYPTGEVHPGVDISKDGISYATVFVPSSMHIPFQGVYSPTHERFLFPVGKFSGFFTNLELRFLDELGIQFYTHDKVDLKELFGIEGEIDGGYYYESKDVVFKNKIEKFYNLRKKYRDELKNEGYSNFIKLIMNSSYGKLGLKSRISRVYDKDFIERLIPRSKYVTYASYVTAWGRLTLFNYIQMAQDSGEVFYVDTDSVHTDAELEDSKELGKLKLEFEGEGWYLGPKFYMLKNSKKTKVKMKGVPGADEKVFRSLLESDTEKYTLSNIFTIQKLYGFLRNRLKNIPPTSNYEMAKQVILKNLLAKRIPLGKITSFQDFNYKTQTKPVELNNEICIKETGMSKSLEYEYYLQAFGDDL